jgi:signal transduction histidine kinase
MEGQNLKTEKSMGEQGYINRNCWLARNLNYPPSRRCQYCELKFRNCLFERYLVMSLILVSLLIVISYLIEKNISRAVIVSIFVLVITYGYFFNKSTEKIIVSNFEEKKAKNAFKELSNTLQDKVDEQTSELREQKKQVERSYEVEKSAKEELQSLDKAKNQFMLAIQHHLRTPLSAMIGYSDLLLNGTYGKQPKKTIEVVKKCQDSTKSLVKMVNEFLDITQFQLGKDVVVLQPSVKIMPIIKEIIDELKFETEKRGIYLKLEKTEKLFAIKADREKLKAALYNLIDNAVKYTLEGGVKVSLESNDGLKIIIKDTGIGMSKEHQENLFNKTFERGEEAKKTFTTGRGIGLYIASQIISAHNGKVWAESGGEGKGSTFYVELPFEK